MQQKFFTTTAQSNFIKNLLLNTALPLYNSVRDNNYLVKGNVYVYKNSLIKCTKSGWFNAEENWTTIVPRMLISSGSQYNVQIELDGDLSTYFTDLMSYATKILTFQYFNGKTLVTEKLYPNYTNPEFPHWVGAHLSLYRNGEEINDVANQSFTLTSTAPLLQRGDINLDGVVTEDDLVLLMAYLGYDEYQDIDANLTPLQLLAADVTADGNINTTDVTQMKRLLLGRRDPAYFNWVSIESSNLDNDIVSADIEVLRSDFYFGRLYLKHTQVFESNQLAYDSDTHKYLGEYLRFYRDIFNTDLMPFYNCFNGVYTSKYFIEDGQVKQSNYDAYQQGNTNLSNRYHAKESFKVLQIPIKLNKKYTIAIDCNSQVLVSPVFISNGKLLELVFNGYKLNLTKAYNKIFSFNHIVFNRPVVVNIDNMDERLLQSVYTEISGLVDTSITMSQIFQKYEKDLYLLVQIPAENNSSVVVLEGDYTDVSSNKYMSAECFYNEDMQYPSKAYLDSILLSELSLVQLNDGNRYPFADRLIEYLLWNVIDENDEIATNVSKTQQVLGVSTDVHAKGVFDDYLRFIAFNTFKGSGKYTNLDINGNIDKDTEKFLFG